MLIVYWWLSLVQIITSKGSESMIISGKENKIIPDPVRLTIVEIQRWCKDNIFIINAICHPNAQVMHCIMLPVYIQLDVINKFILPSSRRIISKWHNWLPYSRFAHICPCRTYYSAHDCWLQAILNLESLVENLAFQIMVCRRYWKSSIIPDRSWRLFSRGSQVMSSLP